MRRWLSLALVVGRQPRLWGIAITQMRRMAPSGWWRHRPFLPVPSGGYLAFRMVTQYGAAEHVPEPDDVVDYLLWCKKVSS